MLLPIKKDTLTDMGRVLLRRWWIILLAIVIGTAGSVVGYTRFPTYYRSEAWIRFSPLATDTATPTGLSIPEQVLSPENLQQVVSEFNLHAEERSDSTSDAVDRLRRQIELTPGVEGTWQLAYVNSNAETAQHVADRVVFLFRESLLNVETMPANTTPSLDAELGALEARLVEHGKKLEQAGRRLPQLTADVAAIHGANTRLRAIDESLRRARARRRAIESRISLAASTRSAQPGTNSAARPAGSGAGESSRPVDQSELETIDRELGALKDEEVRLATRIASSEGRLQALSRRNPALLALTQEFTALRKTYSGLIAKRAAARSAMDVQRHLMGSTFEVIRPASLPSEPSNARQRAVVIGGMLLGSLAVGLGLVAFIEDRYTTFTSRGDVARALALPVLAAVPAMNSQIGASRHRRRGVFSSRR